MAFLVVSGLPVTTLLGNLIIPGFGWRPMFVIAGVGALIVWYLRKALPESPRWLETNGRDAEAEGVFQEAEKESSSGGPFPALPAPPPAPKFDLGSLFQGDLLRRMLVGSWVLITVNTLIFGFVTWLPQFFVAEGLTVTRSLAYTLVIVIGSPIGCAIGAYCADAFGRRPTIIGASVLSIIFGSIYPFTSTPALMLPAGFLLIVAIYIQVAVLFGVYTPELFPTEVRLRANGICNTLGRAATVVSPFIVIALFQSYKIAGVLSLMIVLLLIQILAVWAWGVEPRARPLEALDAPAAAR